MTLTLCLALSLLQDTQRILDAFKAARPADADLAVFKLDWSASLDDAKARAAKEKRPVLLIVTTQTKDAGTLESGHC